MQGRLLFLLAVLVGAFSYSIFFLRVLGYINKFSIGLTSVLLLSIVFIAFIKCFESLKSLYIQAKKNFFYFSIILAFGSINLVGALGPELGFDALWYHLVIPKIFIENQSIHFIPGGLLYYSVMPKLVDLLYIPALMFSGEISAKLMHFSFGLLSAIMTYKVANLFVNKRLSYLAAALFYTNLVVGWMSITAYIDLGRTFFCALSIYFFLLYYKYREIKYFYMSAVVVGLEISTKLLGFGTLISLLLTIIILFNHLTIIERLKKSITFSFIAVLIVLPWSVFSYLNTKNIFYPFFTTIYPSNISFLDFNPFIVAINTFNLFLFSADPISPIYLMVLPLIVILFKEMPREIKILLFILSINIFIWNFIPQKNARFMLAYLPIFSAVSVWVFYKSKKRIQSILYFFILLTFVANIIYRGVANFKYLPVLMGFQTKEDFLIRNLNFDFGDYIDINNDVKKITDEEKVLVKGIHNLYYIDFNYDHESWSNKSDYKFILSRGELSEERGYNLIYHNLITQTYLYEKN